VEAQQFSTTTKLRGEVSFILAGSPDFTSPRRNSDGSRPADPDKTTFNYDARLSFDTSFSGKDLLRTRLRAGNFSSLPFREGIFALDKATGTGDSVVIDRLFYRFPVGESVNLTVGALVRNTEMLSFIPSAYKSDILDYFGLAGASGTYNKATGAGAGLSWRQQVDKGNPYVTFDLNYVANTGFADSSIGAFSSESGINALSQLGLRSTNWGTPACAMPTSAAACPMAATATACRSPATGARSRAAGSPRSAWATATTGRAAVWKIPSPGWPACSGAMWAGQAMPPASPSARPPSLMATTTRCSTSCSTASG